MPRRTGPGMTTFGSAGFPLAARYRPPGSGAAVAPAESVPDLTEGGMALAAVSLSMYPEAA